MVFICCLSFGQAECLTSIFLEKPDLDYTVLYFWIKINLNSVLTWQSNIMNLVIRWVSVWYNDLDVRQFSVERIFELSVCICVCMHVFGWLYFVWAQVCFCFLPNVTNNWMHAILCTALFAMCCPVPSRFALFCSVL